MIRSRSSLRLRTGGVAGAVAAVVQATSRLVRLVGDSRMADSSIDQNTTPLDQITVHGIAYWLEMILGYRIRVTANYGVNANSLAMVVARLSAGTPRGNILGGTQPTSIVLAGVNNGVDTYASMQADYVALINALTPVNNLVFLETELPNNDFSSQGAAHLARRVGLEGQSFANDARVLKVNTWDVMSTVPSGFFSKAGYFGDALHANTRGNRRRAEAIATAMLPSLNSFPPRNTLPAVSSATAVFFPGTGGTNGGGGASGSVATGWGAETPPAGLTVVYSKGTDSNGFDQQIVTISGTTATPIFSFDQWFMRQSIAGTEGVSGDNILQGCRVIIDAGSSGLAAVEVGAAANNDTNGIFLKGISGTINIFDNGTATTKPWLAGDMQGEGMDFVCYSGDMILGAGWTAAVTKSLRLDLGFTFRAGAAVNAVIRLSRAALVKNL